MIVRLIYTHSEFNSNKLYSGVELVHTYMCTYIPKSKNFTPYGHLQRNTMNQWRVKRPWFSLEPRQRGSFLLQSPSESSCDSLTVSFGVQYTIVSLLTPAMTFMSALRMVSAMLLLLLLMD